MPDDRWRQDNPDSAIRRKRGRMALGGSADRFGNDYTVRATPEAAARLTSNLAVHQQRGQPTLRATRASCYPVATHGSKRRALSPPLRHAGAVRQKLRHDTPRRIDAGVREGDRIRRTGEYRSRSSRRGNDAPSHDRRPGRRVASVECRSSMQPRGSPASRRRSLEARSIP